MKIKRAAALLCALTMTFSSAISVLPQSATASTTISYNSDHESWRLTDPQTLLSDKDGVFVIKYKNYGYSSNVSFCYNSEDESGRVYYSTVSSGDGELRISVSDILNAIAENEDDGAATAADVVSACFYAYEDEVDINSIVYYTGTEAKSLGVYSGEYEFDVNFDSFFADEENKLTFKYDNLSSDGIIRLTFNDYGTAKFVDLPISQGKDLELTIKPEDIINNIKKYNTLGKEVSTTLDSTYVDYFHAISAEGAMIKKITPFNAIDELGRLSYYPDTYNVDVLNDNGAFKITYNSTKADSQGLKLIIEDYSYDTYECYIPTAKNEFGEVTLSFKDMLSSLKKDGVSAKPTSINNIYIQGSKDARIRSVETLSEAQYVGVSDLDLNNIWSYIFFSDDEGLSAEFTNAKSAGKNLELEIYDVYGVHYRLKLNVPVSSSRQTVKLSGKDIMNGLEKEVNGSWVSATYFPIDNGLKSLTVHGTNGCLVHDITYYDHSSNDSVNRWFYSSNFFLHKDNTATVTYKSPKAGNNIYLMVMFKDPDTDDAITDYAYAYPINTTVTSGDEYATKTFTRDDFLNNLYKIDLKTGALGAKVTLDDFSNVNDYRFYAFGGASVSNVSTSTSSSSPRSYYYLDQETFSDFVKNGDNTLTVNYSAIMSGTKDLYLYIYNYSGDREYRKYIPTVKGDEGTVTLTVDELFSDMTWYNYSDEESTARTGDIDPSSIDYYDVSIELAGVNGAGIYDCKMHYADKGDFLYEINDDDEDPYVTITGYNGTDTDVVIPEMIDGYPVKIIDSYAFRNEKDITSIKLPSTVTRINSSAFYNCTKLAKVELNEGLQVIRSGAFANCNSLKTLNIPSTVTSISDLNEMPALETITVAAGNKNFEAYDGILYGIEYDWVYNEETDEEEQVKNYYIIKCPEGKTTASVKAGVTYINSYAFSNCKELKSVSLPDSLLIIDYNAFSGCSALTSITIPAKVYSIGNCAFEDCTSLSTITFKNADIITEVYRDSFFGTAWLDAKRAAGSLVILGNTVIDGYGVTGSVTIPEGVTRIGDYAFDGSKVSSVALPSTLEGIGYNAFFDCKNLKSVTVPASVKSIDGDAFGYIYYVDSDGDEYRKVDPDFILYCYPATAALNYAVNENVKYVLIDTKTVKQTLAHNGKSFYVSVDGLLDADTLTLTEGLLTGTDYTAKDVYGYKINFSVSDAVKAKYKENYNSLYLRYGNGTDGYNNEYPFDDSLDLFFNGDKGDNDFDYSGYAFQEKSDGSYTLTRKALNSLFYINNNGAFLLMGSKASDDDDYMPLEGVTFNSVVLYGKNGEVLAILGKDITKDTTEIPVKVTDPSQIRNESDLKQYLSTLTYDKAKAFLKSLDKNIYLIETEYVDYYDSDDNPVMGKRLGYILYDWNYNSETGKMEYDFVDVTSTGIIYHENDDYVDVRGVDGAGKKAIPATINGKPVSLMRDLGSLTILDYTHDGEYDSYGSIYYEFIVNATGGVTLDIPDSVENFGYWHSSSLYVEFMGDSSVKFTYSAGSAAQTYFNENGTDMYGDDGTITWGLNTGESEPSLAGQVTLKSKTAVETTGITVTAVDKNGKETVINANADGSYSYDGLADGNYTLYFRKDGFATSKSSVNIAAGAPASVEVELKLAGDVNGDGEIKMSDLTRLQQYLAAWGVDIDESAADVTGDGVVKMNDLTRLQQYLAAWDVKLSST